MTVIVRIQYAMYACTNTRVNLNSLCCSMHDHQIVIEVCNVCHDCDEGTGQCTIQHLI